MDDIATYKEQLQQVQAALLATPNDPALLELEGSLKQFISLAAQIEGPVSESDSKWKPGTKCLAVWAGDGNYYSAVVDQVNDDGTCQVTFPEYNETAVVKTSSLKGTEPTEDGEKLPEKESKKRPLDEGPVVASQNTKNLLDKEAQREARRKKNAKKRKRKEEVDAAAEKTKSSWQSFAKSSVSSKAKTGFRTGGKLKKSIFASPDAPDGRVGVGTCGIGGKGMTDFEQRNKWSFAQDGDGEK